jgi:hypothetical protein
MRGNANLRYGIILVFPLLLVACIPMAEISIQVLEPAKITLPLYINQVAFINHSYIPRRDPGDTSGLSPKEIFILDTIINNQIFMGLRDGLNNSPLFDLKALSALNIII